MTLTLRIRNVDSLENGAPVELVLHRRGATIGRAGVCDWSLPDAQRFISSRHCEITYRDNAYWLSDVSTNGTYVNSSTERMAGDHKIAEGDEIAIGNYLVCATLSGEVADQSQPQAGAPDGWNWHGEESGETPVEGTAEGWGSPQISSGESDGWRPRSPDQVGKPLEAPRSDFEWGSQRSGDVGQGQEAWAPTHDASGMPRAGSDWMDPEPEPLDSSDWSSGPSTHSSVARPEDIWGRLAEDNVVDWARGGFGSSVSASTPGPTGAAQALPAEPPPQAGSELRQDPRSSGTGQSQRRPASLVADQTFHEFLAAAGLGAEDIKGDRADVLVRSGGLLRVLVAGLALLVEARTRAKSQLGAESTRLEFGGNNPVKFARSPREALAQLLNPPERGFLEAEPAIEQAFYDLQSHQMATLKAMQGALKATLDRFSPSAIRDRLSSDSFLTAILPAARDAALWQAYEREFSGVASGSDEAFMDVFAKEFRKAYEDESRRQRN